MYQGNVSGASGHGTWSQARAPLGFADIDVISEEFRLLSITGASFTTEEVTGQTFIVVSDLFIDLTIVFVYDW